MDSRKSRQKMVKTWQTFVKIAKITAKTRHHGPEDHYTVYKTQHLALRTITTCSARFSSAKFCRHGHISSH